MWKLFWGQDFNRILSSNRKNVVPGAWRVESSPTVPEEEDFFLHVIEIGDAGKTGQRRAELLDGVNLQGSAFERGPMVLFGASGTAVNVGEVSLPDLSCDSLMISGLQSEALYKLRFAGLNVTPSPAAVLPGVSAGSERIRANSKGVLRLERKDLGNLRLRIARV